MSIKKYGHSKIGQGWWGESHPHGLCAKGVKLGRHKPDYAVGGFGPSPCTEENIRRLRERDAELKRNKPHSGVFGPLPCTPENIRKLKQIDYYKITSISNKDDIYGIADAVRQKLADRGYSADVTVKDGAISLHRIVLSEGKVQSRGHNIRASSSTKSGMRRSRNLAWDDWVDVNDAVNDVLDERKINANVSSLGGKFVIRRKDAGRKSRDDWDEFAGENVGSMVNPVSREDLIKRPDYAKMKSISKVNTKEEARQLAVDWQHKFADRSMSYSELAEDSQYFRELGKKFRLTGEFKENGII